MIEVMHPRWRWAHRLYAWIFRYFWSPCPICGRHFGGHEWREIDGKPDTIIVEVGATWTRGRGICPQCTVAGHGRRAFNRMIRQAPND
jgi:hypothetical protein